MRKAQALLIVVTILLSAPVQAGAAIHFGGSINTLIHCLNDVTYVELGPPRGGLFLWSPTITETYPFGPPKHTNQWLLGNAGPSYFCLVSVLPVEVKPGLFMMMMGSSQ